MLATIPCTSSFNRALLVAAANTGSYNRTANTCIYNNLKWILFLFGKKKVNKNYMCICIY